MHLYTSAGLSHNCIIVIFGCLCFNFPQKLTPLTWNGTSGFFLPCCKLSIFIFTNATFDFRQIHSFLYINLFPELQIGLNKVKLNHSPVIAAKFKPLIFVFLLLIDLCFHLKEIRPWKFQRFSYLNVVSYYILTPLVNPQSFLILKLPLRFQCAI